MLFSANDKMKNIYVLQQINILRIYTNVFGLKGFYWDFNSHPHFSFCQTTTSPEEMQMSIWAAFSRGIILNQILNICIPHPEKSGVKTFYKKLPLPAAAWTSSGFTIWLLLCFQGYETAELIKNKTNQKKRKN